MKKVIIIVIVVLIIAGGGYWIWKSVSQPKTPQVTEEASDQGFKLAEGNYSLSAQYVTDPLKADYGIAVYPSAKPVADKQAAGTVDLNGKKLLIASFTTSDSTSQVIAFYQKQMGSSLISGDVESGGIDYKIMKTKNSQSPIVGVYTKDNTTYFTLVKPLQ